MSTSIVRMQGSQSYPTCLIQLLLHDKNVLDSSYGVLLSPAEGDCIFRGIITLSLLEWRAVHAHFDASVSAASLWQQLQMHASAELQYTP